MRFRLKHRSQSAARSGAFALGVLLGSVAAMTAQTPEPTTGLAEGGIAASDLFAPVDFTVVDAAATARAFALSGETTPIVMRTNAAPAEATIAQFTTAFRRARTTFLDALEATFGARQVGSREINSARFRNFRNDFQSANPLFPVNLVLAQTWAKGYDGEPARERLVVALRSVTESRLIGEARPASTVFVTTLQPSDRVRTWGEAEPHTRAVARNDVLTIEEAGEEMRRGLDALDRTAGAFLTGLLQPNVIEDPVLTGLLFQERFGDRAITKHFRNGQPIVRAGQRLDHWGALALAQLSRGGLEPVARDTKLARLPETSATRSTAADAGVEDVTVAPRWRSLLLIGGGALGAIVVVALLWIAAVRLRRTRHAWVAGAQEPAEQIPVTREALLPHLARAMRDRLVHVLFAQRGALLANEAAASQRVEELEARLARLQPAIADRIREYERRIALLEVEIEVKDKETRDLIRAKLVLARQELDAEIGRNRLDWN
jgi:hypothetical protein